jgi:fatty acyl-CoA reductase
LTEKNFGLSDGLMEELMEKVNIVYHGAATIRFNSYLGDAIKINLGDF